MSSTMLLSLEVSSLPSLSIVLSAVIPSLSLHIVRISSNVVNFPYSSLSLAAVNFSYFPLSTVAVDIPYSPISFAAIDFPYSPLLLCDRKTSVTPSSSCSSDSPVAAGFISPPALPHHEPTLPCLQLFLSTSPSHH
ncbi:hypothetical protein ACLOJK_007441 [Asimina triloba]